MQEKMVYCNKCGKAICIEEEIEKADYLKIEKNWGYFSNKDGICHKINICEQCYDEIVAGFMIPVAIEENTELL